MNIQKNIQTFKLVCFLNEWLIIKVKIFNGSFSSEFEKNWVQTRQTHLIRKHSDANNPMK